MDSPCVLRQRIVLRGLVQGVGLRPAVCRLARELGLTGWVQNEAAGASIEIQGTEVSLAAFRVRLGSGPPSARIESVEIELVPPVPECDFVIRPSSSASAGATSPPVDLAPCASCLAEFHSPRDRRHGYPFINCTACGPRFTILKGMPFDRVRTSMAAFPLCDCCFREYSDQSNRRFHAEAIACAECGPQVEWRGENGECLQGQRAIEQAKRILAAGGVIALKGVGGFHLLCPASDPKAVDRIRQIKRRPHRPLAILASSLPMIRQYAAVDEREAEWLEHPTRPIVLLRSIGQAANFPLALCVAPGVNTLGFMLPSMPLHHLLLDDRPLVVTSGNLSGEPLICDSSEAQLQFDPHVDGILDHDRNIEVRCDDSVLQVVRDEPRMIRRSRGFVPEPLKVVRGGPCVLAVGGEYKTAPAVILDDRVFPGPHVGDLQGWPGLQALNDAVTHLCQLLHCRPEAIACDAHPGYLSHRWAKDFARQRGIPCLLVPHHQAHVASWQVDVGREHELALVVVFDGTGLGPDGTLWGSEFFHVAGIAPAVSRASLKPVPLPGGELAVRHPVRMALAHLTAADVPDAASEAVTGSLTERERRMIRVQIERGIHSPLTRSMGRLFDAVASILGVCQEPTYEGQPAIELEALAEPTEMRLPDFQMESGPRGFLINPAPLLGGLVQARRTGESPRRLGYAFHIAVARMIVDVLMRLREETGISLVGFSGGVFQNRLLEEILAPRLHEAHFEARYPTRLPCNDGGLAVGQAVLARRFLTVGPD